MCTTTSSVKQVSSYRQLITEKELEILAELLTDDVYWWLNLFKNDPVNIFVETTKLFATVIYLLIFNSQKRKEGVGKSSDKEQSEIIMQGEGIQQTPESESSESSVLSDPSTDSCIIVHKSSRRRWLVRIKDRKNANDEVKNVTKQKKLLRRWLGKTVKGRSKKVQNIDDASDSSSHRMQSETTNPKSEDMHDVSDDTITEKSSISSTSDMDASLSAVTQVILFRQLITEKEYEKAGDMIADDAYVSTPYGKKNKAWCISELRNGGFPTWKDCEKGSSDMECVSEGSKKIGFITFKLKETIEINDSGKIQKMIIDG